MFHPCCGIDGEIRLNVGAEVFDALEFGADVSIGESEVVNRGAFGGFELGREFFWCPERICPWPRLTEDDQVHGPDLNCVHPNAAK